MDDYDTVKMSHTMFYELTYKDGKEIVPRREKPAKSSPFLEVHRLLRREAQQMSGNADRETLSTLLLVSKGGVWVWEGVQYSKDLNANGMCRRYLMRWQPQRWKR